VIFALGSVLAAQADSIWGVIAGRILQGAGAISAAVMALLSDLTREQHRTKAMAMIGMSIGLSFAVAMVVGPLLTRAFGLSGLFSPPRAGPGRHRDRLRGAQHPPHLQHRESGVARQAWARPCATRTCCAWTWAFRPARHPDGQLRRAAAGLVEKAGLPKEQHWWVYLTALLISFCHDPVHHLRREEAQDETSVAGAVSVLLLTELFFWQFG
jgi:hypothetical protein